MNTIAQRYQMYLKMLEKPYKKLTRLEFLQPDGSVAFTLGNQSKHNKTFIQSGTLNVALQNGIRRQSSITFDNINDEFEYNVNKIWFGSRVRLSMGLTLPDDTDFYLPQGVFYFSNPKEVYNPNAKTAEFSLVDKWAYLDGSLFGNLQTAHQVNSGTNVFNAMKSIIQLSKFTFSSTSDIQAMIDPVSPVFTNYYNDKTYNLAYSDTNRSGTVSMATTPYDFVTSADGKIADVLLGLNEFIVGLIGYDQTGALRVEPSQDNIDDIDKPVLWNFTPQNSELIGIESTYENTQIYNDIIVTGQGNTGYEVWGRATNIDPKSDTNINIIGRKLQVINDANYWNAEQCADLAKWKLKRTSILTKTVAIQSVPMFHLIENRLVSVKRTDKKGVPTEKHLIQSFSLPLGETGTMTINATSVFDIPQLQVQIERS